MPGNWSEVSDEQQRLLILSEKMQITVLLRFTDSAATWIRGCMKVVKSLQTLHNAWTRTDPTRTEPNRTAPQLSSLHFLFFYFWTQWKHKTRRITQRGDFLSSQVTRGSSRSLRSLLPCSASCLPAALRSLPPVRSATRGAAWRIKRSGLNEKDLQGNSTDSVPERRQQQQQQQVSGLRAGWFSWERVLPDWLTATHTSPGCPGRVSGGTEWRSRSRSRSRRRRRAGAAPSRTDRTVTLSALTRSLPRRRHASTHRSCALEPLHNTIHQDGDK